MTISDIRTLNKRAGQSFFNRKTMKFFESRIESTLMKGNYFITSEKPPHNPRHYKVRQYDQSNHHILSISGEIQYSAAKQLIRDLQKGIV